MTAQISQELKELQASIYEIALNEAKENWEKLKQKHQQSIANSFPDLPQELVEEISKALLKNRKSVPDALVVDSIRRMKLGTTMYKTFRDIKKP